MIGKIDGKILESIFETIPIEFSVLDENDKVLAWNKHETRIFKRPEAALGRDVRQCHPERSLDKVETIINEMKEGIRDKARFWIDLPLGKNGQKEKVMIEYYALRDKKGNYLGCLESSQNIAEIQKLEGQKRLL
ncbi:MAG: PAS domain S-box protein [Candidatus Methanofastidiosa archaeon]|jgi:PAS domain S-box-containing protein|nr:PAS domain S-box protein [Candidatus Methanofastidiosa archaeon]